MLAKSVFNFQINLTLYFNKNVMKLSVEDFLEKSKTVPLIDVRTPAEYNKGHIPGAYNIPLLSNEERAIVGTMYKQEGKEPAFEKALEFSGPNMVSFVREAKKKAIDNKLLVYCWRGGMRSGSMAWLFNAAGIESHTLDGGYKAFRRHIHAAFDTTKKIIVLGGYTGSGKTEILKELSKQVQVVDLEGFARHKGSAFGFIGQSEQPTTEQFENNLGTEWLKLNPDKDIWLEDESRNIGRVYLPDSIYNKIRNARVIFIEIPKDKRIKRLIKDYAGYDDKLLQKAIDKIKKRIGGHRYQLATKALKNKDYWEVADIALSYYDKAYLFGLNKREKEKIFKLRIIDNNPGKVSKIILDYYQSLNIF